MSVASFLQQTITAPHWRKIGARPHHGICVPLFSLHSQQSCGIGEFLDLLPLIDWCKQVGLDCIQLLPLNDTGSDPSPYYALTSCGLHPLYLSLANLPDAQDLPTTKEKKWAWLNDYFHRVFVPTQEFKEFVEKQQWLRNYALFKVCKEMYQGAAWHEWPHHQQSPKTCLIDNPKRFDFYCFLQFFAFHQLQSVKQYANERGVLLMGDIPILISPDSVDVWANRLLFDLSCVAGAPPDAYNKEGQKWGFPLFHLDAMRSNQFAWWRERLRVAEEFYDLYRIDHVVGFFRIWAIEKTKKALSGQFQPQDETLWEPQGREMLVMMVNATSMLPIAEDLGTIPPIVYSVLKELGICGTKVMRWQRRWKEDLSFIPPQDYEPISLTTLSTPDSEPLGLWWTNHPDEARLLARSKEWNYEPHLTLSQRKELLRDSHRTSSLFHINLLQEYLALFPSLISFNPEEERINVPGTSRPANWTYRFRPSVEELIQHNQLADTMQQFLQESTGGCV